MTRTGEGPGSPSYRRAGRRRDGHQPDGESGHERLPRPIPSQSRLTRRGFAAAILGAGIAGAAGCLEAEEPDPDDAGGDDVDPDLRINDTALDSSFPLELLDPDSEQMIANVHWHDEFSHWHFGPLEVPYDRTRPVQARFNDRDYDPIPLGPDETYQLGVFRTEDTSADLLEVSVERAITEIAGVSRGEGALVFQLESADTAVWISPPLHVAVG